MLAAASLIPVTWCQAPSPMGWMMKADWSSWFLSWKWILPPEARLKPHRGPELSLLVMIPLRTSPVSRVSTQNETVKLPPVKVFAVERGTLMRWARS